MNHKDMVALVEKIMKADGTEDEINLLVDDFCRNIPHPDGSGLIFWPQNYGLGMDPAAEEIVTTALAYKSIQLPPKSS